jgi:hypothetical protein
MQTAGLPDTFEVSGYKGRPFSLPDKLAAAVYAIALLWINAYICRELFHQDLAPMASMHGFWAALAERAQGSWFHAAWWPYWDGGMPFEFTYAPLVPALTAAWAAARGIPHTIAFNAVTGALYCLAPVTLFAMAWILSRSPGYSFLAALFYSLTSSGQLFVPDEASLKSFWYARRLYLVASWDDTPHLAAVTLLPLIVLLLWLSLRERRIIYYAGAAATIGLAALASAFGPVIAIISVICVVAVHPRRDYARNFALTLAIGAFGYALAASFLPPSLVAAMRSSSEGLTEPPTWTVGSLTAVALLILGWIVLWRCLNRWAAGTWLRFLALFAFVMSSIPILALHLHRRFLPQPVRYQAEMEMALSLLLVFGAKIWLERAPRSVRRAALFLILALAAEQIVSHRDYAKNLLRGADPAQTLEYRAAQWTAQNLPGVRVMMPGTLAQWANAFTDVQQYSGGSWSVARNSMQQRGLAAIFNGGDTPEKDARVSLAWLKAFGVGAVGVSAPGGQEFWKPYAHPSKFDAILPVLWRDSGVTFYRVPQRSASFAHVVPEPAVVRTGPLSVSDIDGLESYNSAVDDPSLPLAGFQWDGRNRIHIRGVFAPGQALSVQVSHHPGWHASVAGRDVPIHRDGIGLMWLTPPCSGACEVQLDYDGGWELRLCRWLSSLAIASLFVIPVWVRIRRR